MLAEELRLLEQEIAQVKGDFAFFAAFEHEDVVGKWDLIVSASWFAADKQEAYRFLTERVNSKLTPMSASLLSRIVLLDPSDPIVKLATSGVQCEHATRELVNCEYNGFVVKHAYYVTSKGSAAGFQVP